MPNSPDNQNTPEKEPVDINKILEKNLEMTEKIYEHTKYIKRYVIMSQVMSVLKILIIAIPIVLGLLYLPPLLKEYKPLFQDSLDTYRELLGVTESVNTGEIEIDPALLKKLPPEAVDKYLR